MNNALLAAFSPCLDRLAHWTKKLSHWISHPPTVNGRVQQRSPLKRAIPVHGALFFIPMVHRRADFHRDNR